VAWQHIDFTAIARKNFAPMEPRLTLVDSEEETLPGVAMLDTGGHTPGYVVITFTSAGEKLMYTADTVIFPLHLEHPEWTPVFDMIPEKAEASKRRAFDMAAAENCWSWRSISRRSPVLGISRNARRLGVEVRGG
jgi:glyoxylase-like metal-dependent hydrolase (beta-lactamase superfamily II)